MKFVFMKISQKSNKCLLIVVSVNYRLGSEGFSVPCMTSGSVESVRNS